MAWWRLFRRKPTAAGNIAPETLRCAGEVSADEGAAADPKGFPSIKVTDILDLHTFAPKETGAVLEEYLSEARAKGYTTVRIIHGKGIGAQRERVRAILSRAPFVESYTDAPAEAGGWGATIVWFRTKPDEVL